MNRWLILIFGTVPLAGHNGTALLMRAVETYKAAKTLYFDCTVESELTAQNSRSWTRSREIVANGAQWVRIESASPQGSFILVADGKSTHIASIDTRKFVRRNSSPAEVKDAGR